MGFPGPCVFLKIGLFANIHKSGYFTRTETQTYFSVFWSNWTISSSGNTGPPSLCPGCRGTGDRPWLFSTQGLKHSPNPWPSSSVPLPQPLPDPWDSTHLQRPSQSPGPLSCPEELRVIKQKSHKCLCILLAVLPACRSIISGLWTTYPGCC